MGVIGSKGRWLEGGVLGVKDIVLGMGKGGGWGVGGGVVEGGGDDMICSEGCRDWEGVIILWGIDYVS